MEEGKSKSTSVSGNSAFLLEDTIPDIAGCYFFAGEELSEAIKTANIVLDANVLLLPYGAGGKSLAATGEAYRRIASEGRLYVPSRALREYLRNRPNKISELLQSLNNSISRFPAAPEISYPILEGLKDFDALSSLIGSYKELRKQIMDARAQLHEQIVSWRLRDPVLEEYRKSIPDSSIKDINIDREAAIKELEGRYSLSIPPGYKDAAKDDGGIGDFVIWKTILEIGEATKKSTIFVSGEEKSDWQHRVNSSGFLPRLELIDEYRRKSSGGSFFIIQLSDLLEFFHATPELVEEIKQEEQRISAATNPIVSCPYCEAQASVYLGSPIGSSASPICDNCRSKFHVHRTRDGVIVNAWGERKASAPATGMEQTILACPQCGEGNSVEIGTDVGSSRWTTCHVCGIKMSAHREQDGGIFVNIHK